MEYPSETRGLDYRQSWKKHSKARKDPRVRLTRSRPPGGVEHGLLQMAGPWFRPKASVIYDPHSPMFAHRYLQDGRTEFICMNCLEVVCSIQRAEDASTHLKTHACQSAEWSLSALRAAYRVKSVA